MRLLLVVVCLATTLYADDFAPNPKEAKRAAKAAEKAMRSGDYAAAFAAYKEATEGDPRNVNYVVGRELAKQAYSAQLMREKRYAEAYAVDPTNDRAREKAEQVDHPIVLPPKPVPPSRSTPADEDVTPPLMFEPRKVKLAWNLKGDTKALYLAVGSAYGIHFDFEDEVQPVVTRLVMEETDFEHAVTALGIITRTFTAPIAPKGGIVAQDISVKHLQYGHQVLRALDVTELGTPEAINEAANLLRTVFDMRQVTANVARKEIIVRDELSRVDQADMAIHALSYGQAQVAFEFQTLLVNSTFSRMLGVLPTQTYSVTPLATHLGKLQVVAPATPAIAAAFGGGTSMMAVTVPQATLTALDSSSDTRATTMVIQLANDGQQAIFTSGVRYPIVTGVVSYGSVSAIGGTTGSSAIPNFTYVDLGVKIKATPHVHGDGEITVVLEATTSALGGQVFNANPTIDNRELTAQVRLREGETVILAGMLTRSESKTLTGLPGAAEIMGLSALLAQRNTTRDQTDVLLLVTPHLVRPSAAQTQLTRTVASPDHSVPVLR